MYINIILQNRIVFQRKREFKKTTTSQSKFPDIAEFHLNDQHKMQV